MKAISRNPKGKEGPKQSIDVYCRLRPVEKFEEVSINVIPPSIVSLISPSGTSQLRNGLPSKEMQYTFKKVFNKSTSQKEMFETVALPLVENLLKGGNGLLFTYGVTGSGKTYTMTGTKSDSGIMPRCIDTIFNSIAPFKAERYIFKPDRLNGFDIQSEADALMERQQEFIQQLTPAKGKKPKLEGLNSEFEFAKRDFCENKVNKLSPDNTYGVFITFVEIYNNSVYDLLEDNSNDLSRRTPLKATPQVKIIREDSDHNMFVHGVTEVEVSSAEEAFQVFHLGQKKRKIAHTALNAESSRAHTIFTIRVVQAPLDEHGQVIVEKKYMQVSQLSLVDLAGSERAKRTEHTGQRLREAGNINNSLMTLRSCMETLRENQKGANKMVPYRESRLTHLFKSFFEGEGLVAMVVCVNPRADDYDENMQVLKFAEVSQEVQIFCPPTPKIDIPHRPRKRLVYDDKENKNVVSPTIGFLRLNEIFSNFPVVGYLGLDEESDECIRNTVSYYEERLRLFENFGTSISQRDSRIREAILGMDKDVCLSKQEIEKYKMLYERERGRVSELENKVRNSDQQMFSYKRKVDDYEMDVKRLKRELSEKELQIKKSNIDTNKVKEQMNSKIAKTEEKLKGEMERKLRSQKSALEFELRSRERKLREAKRVLSDEALRTFPATPEPERFRVPAVPSTPLSTRPPSPNFRSTSRKNAPTGWRGRRSRSADTWLEHKPPTAVEFPTVLQPVLNRRKSVSKLTDAKDVLDSGADQNCLVTQGQDSDGDLEARIYKDNNPEAEQFRKLFIGGLDYRTTQDTLKGFYEQWGEIVDVVVMKHAGKTGKSRGYGFVTYSKSSMVDDAMQNRPHKIDGREVVSERAVPRDESGQSNANVNVKKMFVGGIKEQTEDELKEYFGQFGNIVTVNIVVDKQTQKRKGFAFIEFDDYDPVDKALLRKDHVVGGKSVTVKKAVVKDGPGGGGPGGRGSRGGAAGGRGGRGSSWGGGGSQWGGSNGYGAWDQQAQGNGWGGQWDQYGGGAGGWSGNGYGGGYGGGGPMRNSYSGGNRSAPYGGGGKSRYNSSNTAVV